MPSTLVHVALAGLLAAGLLGAAFDRRALLVVLGVTIVPDFDAFLGLAVTGGHRALLHTFVIPIVAGLLVWTDARRGRSRLRGRFGPDAIRIAGVAILAYAVAAIGLDLTTGGVNPFYPVHDQFYTLNGKLELSSTKGIVQTFVETSDGGAPAPEGLGSTQEVHVSSGVDPSPGTEPANVERVFPIVRSGWQLLLVVASVVTVGGRLRDADA